MIRPIENDHPGDWHMGRFAEFVTEKQAIGEPTPHMTWVTWLAKDLPEQERLWLAGCYLAAYSTLTGEAIAREWPHERYLRERAAFLPWLKENWGGVHTSTPRRCVRTPGAFAKCVSGYADWMEAELPSLRELRLDNPEQLYDAWWNSATKIPYYGRYITIRLLELLRRWGYLAAPMYDIRAVGAHSPIRCLMLLRPDAIEPLATGERQHVDRVANEVLSDTRAAGSPSLTPFVYATLLCEYRASYEGRTDYPGRQHDEALAYDNTKYGEYWRARGYTSRLWDARAAVDPHECLGEMNGWQGLRLDVGAMLHERGLVWSDLKFDYAATRQVGSPILRGWNG